MGTAALRTYIRRFRSHYHFPAPVTVVCRNPVSPPQLAADAPVADIIGPVEINLLQTFRNQFYITVFHRFHRGLNQFIHLYEPLFLYQRFYGCLTAVMSAYIVGIIFNLYQQPLTLQLRNDGSSRLIPVHTAVFSAVLVDGGIVVHHIDNRQVMALSHLKVVGVVGRRNLYHTCTEFHVHISVRNDRNHPVHNGKHDTLSYQMPVTLILGMDCHRGIAQHGLRTGGGKSQEFRGAGGAVIVHHRIFDVPQMPCLLLILHLRIGN